MSQPAPTREERIARYAGQFSAETLAANATIADKTTNPNAPKNRDRTPGT